MLKNRFIKWSLKILSALLSFCLIFVAIQPFFVPKYLEESTVIVKGYSLLNNNSIDVLFLGASQTFYAVDAGKLTNEYNISSYDFASTSQRITITPYYLSEALKTQNPKLAMVEVCHIFDSNQSIDTKVLSWNYSPTPPSILKYQSVYNVLDGDAIKAFEYTYVPLLLYHDRWSSINDKRHGGEHDIDFVFHPENYIDSSSRGFIAHDRIEKREIVFEKSDNSLKNIPAENVNAIHIIKEICSKNNIELVFFKAPASNWTQGESQSVKQFMRENKLIFVDLNDYLKEIGINGEMDFFDKKHLNNSGAEKTTDYLAKIIPQYIQ